MDSIDRPENKFSELKGARVLITGGSGFIGTALAMRLISQYHAEIFILDKVAPLKATYSDSRNYHFQPGDVTNKKDVALAMTMSNPDVVFHLAAYAPIGWSIQFPVESIETSVVGTVNVLEAARSLKKDPIIIVASSDKAYGNTHDSKEFLTEDAPLSPRHPYDVAKAAEDLIAQSYSAYFDVSVGIVRMANVYGPGDMYMNRLIPYVISCALDKRSPVFRMPLGTERNYLFITDAVQGYFSLASALIKEEVNSGEAWNFSSPSSLTTLEVVTEIYYQHGLTFSSTDSSAYEVLGAALPYSETESILLNSDKAKAYLKWEPAVSLADGIHATRAFIENSHHYLAKSIPSYGTKAAK